MNTAFYPCIEPYSTYYLKVDEVHTLYVEESGNPTGLPVVYCHGGPGFGCDVDNRRYFDPEIYRIILFDQRGAGKSIPFAEIKNNFTLALVLDMEKIRRHLGIEQWVVFGGSWGSTLSLVYAETFPERVLALIVRGIFLARHEDIEWCFAGGGAKYVYPEYWQDFYEFIPLEERSDLLKAYYHRLIGSDETLKLQAARTWVTWQATCALLQPSAELLAYVQEPEVAFSAALLETHYYSKGCFLSPNQILANAYRLQNIPVTIIHGRYDMIFNVKNAWDLHLALPRSTLKIIENGGHAALDPPVTQALVEATKSMAQKLAPITI
ncbi:proline iminopeptidase [Legionella norrlandica]|uniref:Proline iminopeptidase n=1 Tax=Legionella norrlandica TaxID=1498499 RepID=A0A0A2SWX6_9GAMM|nr:prolyl aminopeptidase [Legionella norrlandica]KGP64241.1 proline iminopeptidase [Legionella norrlandica]